MVRALGCANIAGASLSNTCIVSFQYGIVKSFLLKYGKNKEIRMSHRTSHLSRLKEHRNRRGLTQIELAKISGVGRATIAGLEASDPKKGSQRGAYRST